VNARPGAAIMYFLNHKFGMGLAPYATLDPRDAFGSYGKTRQTMAFANVSAE